MSVKLNRDLLNSVPVREAAVTTMAIIDAIQDSPAEHQLIAITAAYKLMTERFNISPHDTMAVADNVMHHADGRRVEFLAVADYLEGEI